MCVYVELELRSFAIFSNVVFVACLIQGWHLICIGISKNELGSTFLCKVCNNTPITQNLLLYLELLQSIHSILFGKIEKTQRNNAEPNYVHYFDINELNESIYGYMNQTLNVFNIINDLSDQNTQLKINVLKKLNSELKNQFSDYLGFDLQMLIKEYLEFMQLIKSELENGILKPYNSEENSNEKRNIIMNFVSRFCEGCFGLSVFNFCFQLCWNMITSEAFVES